MRLLHKNQRGFTLVELLIAIAITGLITGGIAMAIFQVFNINTISGNQMVVVRQVQNAGYWVSRDAQMAQSVLPDGGATGFPLTLTWAEYSMDGDGDVHEVVYTLVDNKLQRGYSVDDIPSGTTFVAQYIDISNTSAVFSGSKLTLTVTAKLGTGFQEANETRTYEVIPRPGS